MRIKEQETRLILHEHNDDDDDDDDDDDICLIIKNSLKSIIFYLKYSFYLPYYLYVGGSVYITFLQAVTDVRLFVFVYCCHLNSEIRQDVIG